MSERTLSLDLETRSVIDLTKQGVHIYAKHPSTRILSASYSFDQGRTIAGRWRPWLKQDMPSDLADALHQKDVEVQGWNALSFERLLMLNVAGIEIDPARIHDTMQRARSMALPGKLELCALALEMPYKKLDDSAMRKWMKPLPDGTWADDPDEYEELCHYCDYDVLSEGGLAQLLRPLSPEERMDCVVNEMINDRGLMVDLQLAQAAQRFAKDELAEICDQLNIITQNVGDPKDRVTSPKQYQRIKKWLGDNLPDELQWVVEPDEETGKVSFDAAAREDLLSAEYEDVLTGDLRDFVELVHDGGKASVAKFATMQMRAGDDQRIRGAYNLNGAAQTGRFSSTGYQAHNLIRAGLPNIEDVIEAILRGDNRDDLIRLAGFDADGGLAFTDGKRKERIKKPYNILTILSRTLRPAIIAPLGKVLVWRDWSAIEARVLPWLSGENSASALLDLFAHNEDVYKHQAMASFGLMSVEEVSDIQRQGGKVQILSFGFGGGSGAGMRMARAYGIDIDERTAEGWKNAWRQTNPWAQRFWSNLETAAFSAVRHPEETFAAGRVTYMCAQDVLWCMLPSGRMIAYPFPEIRSVPGRWGPQDAVTAIKGSFHPKKGTSYWPRMKLWGGIQAENCTQAEAASLLRWARREVHANGWPQIGDTHDEILLEVDEDEEQDAQAALKDIMDNPPFETFAGLPLSSEGGSGYAYKSY